MWEKPTDYSSSHINYEQQVTVRVCVCVATCFELTPDRLECIACLFLVILTLVIYHITPLFVMDLLVILVPAHISLSMFQPYCLKGRAGPLLVVQLYTHAALLSYNYI